MEPTPKELRAARLATVLSRGVREGDLDAADALRVLRHELRRINTGRAEAASKRSVKAQAVIDKYADDPKRRPRNGSPEALHSDHVYALTMHELDRLYTVEEWVRELERLREVVCVTAAENYTLMKVENGGTWGYPKYDAAEIVLIDAP